MEYRIIESKLKAHKTYSVEKPNTNMVIKSIFLIEEDFLENFLTSKE
jgi:hypothetical protein